MKPCGGAERLEEESHRLRKSQRPRPSNGVEGMNDTLPVVEELLLPPRSGRGVCSRMSSAARAVFG